MHRSYCIRVQETRDKLILTSNIRHGFPSRLCSSVTLRGPPLDSEKGLTGELWSNRVLLILENKDNSIFFGKKNTFKIVRFLRKIFYLFLDFLGFSQIFFNFTFLHFFYILRFCSDCSWLFQFFFF